MTPDVWLSLRHGPCRIPHHIGPPTTTDPLVEAMHTALWPATFGYFFEQLMSPVIDGAAVARGRALFQKFVRPRGPFLTLALGGQPYGVLPVSSLSVWKNAQGLEDPLARSLSVMQANWVQATAFVPRLGRGTDAGGRSECGAHAISGVNQVALQELLQMSIITMQAILPDLIRFWTVVSQSRDWRTARRVDAVGTDRHAVLARFHF